MELNMQLNMEFNLGSILKSHISADEWKTTRTYTEQYDFWASTSYYKIVLPKAWEDAKSWGSATRTHTHKHTHTPIDLRGRKILRSSARDLHIIKIDTELNETTPVLSFNRCQVDFYIIKKIIQNYMANGPQKWSMLTLMGPNNDWAATES